MTRIVTTTYRYKPPPKRKGRKLAEITGPAVVTAKGGRRPGPLRGCRQAAAEVEENANARPPAGGAEPSTPLGEKPAPANDDRKPAIVTARKPRSWRSDVPDMTPGEHKRRGDAADALFHEMKRRIADARHVALPPPQLKKPG